MALISLPNFKPFLQGNMRVLAFREALLATIAGLTGGLDLLFVKEVLGADALILGLFASVWSAVFLLFVLVGGWIGDRYDKKKTLLLGTALTLPNPLIVALAQTWHVLLLVNFLGALGAALATPAYIALLVTSVEQHNRSRAIAFMNTLTSLANTLTPPLGAFFIQWLGGLDEMRMIFLIQLALSLGVWIYTLKTLQIKSIVEKQETKGFFGVIKDIFGQMKKIYHLSRERKATPWLYLSLTGPFAWEVVGPFWAIYAAEVCGSPLFVIGVLIAIYSLTHALLQLPLANLSDEKGRKRVILMTRPFLYLCLIILLMGGTYKSWVWAPLIPLLAWGLRAIGDSSSPSWTAASTEVIPEEMQSGWEALRGFLWRITAIPSSLLGGLLWNIDPRLPFIMALTVDGLLRLPILIYSIPETLMVHRTYPRVLGPHIVIYGLPGAGLTSTARLLQKQIQAEIVDESLAQGPQERGLRIPHLFKGNEDKRIERQVDEILTHKDVAIVEGKPAVFAAGEADKATIVLLVAPREERALREAKKREKPEFVALKEVEDKDRKIARLTRRLYGADISKLPPFDVAINTDRISPDKVAKIISILRGEGEEKK